MKTSSSIILFVIVSLLFSTSCVGCGVTNSNADYTKKQYTLSDRQIEILKEEGLPTDYNELTLSQKVSIEAIEDIFSYLDKKYPDDTFTYSGYVSGDYMNNEHLVVDSPYGEVEVYRDISGDEKKYEDNYNEVKASILYTKVLNDYLSTMIPDDDFVISSNIDECKSDTWNKDNILSVCGGSCLLFVKESVGKEKFEYVIKKLSKYVANKAKKTSNPVTIDFYLVKNEKFNINLPNTYQELTIEGIFIDEKSYCLSSDGNEHFY